MTQFAFVSDSELHMLKAGGEAEQRLKYRELMLADPKPLTEEEMHSLSALAVGGSDLAASPPTMAMRVARPCPDHNWNLECPIFAQMSSLRICCFSTLVNRFQ